MADQPVFVRHPALREVHQGRSDACEARAETDYERNDADCTRCGATSEPSASDYERSAHGCAWSDADHKRSGAEHE